MSLAQYRDFRLLEHAEKGLALLVDELKAEDPDHCLISALYDATDLELRNVSAATNKSLSLLHGLMSLRGEVERVLEPDYEMQRRAARVLLGKPKSGAKLELLKGGKPNG